MLRCKIGPLNEGLLATLTDKEVAHHMGEYLVALDVSQMVDLLETFGLLTEDTPYVLTRHPLEMVSEDVQVFRVEEVC